MKFTEISFLLLLFVTPFGSLSYAQFLPDNATYWWMETDDGVKHYVLELGDHPDPEKTIVVLHGGYGAEHSYLMEMLLPFSEEYRFILYDQRGSLRTEAPDSTLTFESFIHDLDHLRQQLKLDKLNLLAHSNGSNIALDYLGTYPQSVNGILLMAPPLSFIHSGAFSDSANEALGDLIEIHRAEVDTLQAQIALQIEKKTRKMALHDTEHLSDRERSVRGRIEYAAWHTTSPNNWPLVRNAFFNPAVFENLSKNVDSDTWRARTLRKSTAFLNENIPVRVMIGHSDYTDPKAIVWEEIIQHAKDGGLTVLENAGHNAWVDNPEEFNEALYLLLQEIVK
jgi:proline iminopeptidase